MTKFYTYNIQLLPNSNKIKEVGTAGYKQLFALLRDLNKDHVREKTLQEFHHKITSDIYIGPDKFFVKETYFYGYFVKYTVTDQVTSLNKKRLFFKTKAMKQQFLNQKTFHFYSMQSVIIFALKDLVF